MDFMICYVRKQIGNKQDIIKDLPGCPRVTASPPAGAAAGSCRLMGNREPLGTAALVWAGAACICAGAAALLFGNKGCGTPPTEKSDV